MKKASAIATIVAIVALTFSGCAEATRDTSSKTGSNASVSPDAEPAGSEEEGDGTFRFGETVNYEDGLAVTVSKPQPYKPSEWAAYDESAPTHLKFKVTIVNGTDEPFDATLMYITVQSGDIEAEQAFDSEAKIGDAPTTQLLKGRQATYWVAFGVQNRRDIVMEVSDPLGHEPAIFTNVAS